MAKIGQMNHVKVIKSLEFGLYVDGGDLGEVLIPNRYVPDNVEVGQMIDAFIYLDSQDRLVATTETPLASVGEVVYLRVNQVNRTGAFMDWGMPKDLMVPFSEQRVPMEAERSYCVYLYIDNSGRIAASSNLSHYLFEKNDNFKSGQEVDLLVVSRSDMGYTAVINGTHLGLIHSSDILQPLHMGQKLKGFIKGIRSDHKINLRIHRQGAAARDELGERILAFLAENNGVSTITDKSSPDEIFQQYRTSKANYKKTLGRLLKAKKITITPEKISLVSK